MTTQTMPPSDSPRLSREHAARVVTVVGDELVRGSQSAIALMFTAAADDVLFDLAERAEPQDQYEYFRCMRLLRTRRDVIVESFASTLIRELHGSGGYSKLEGSTGIRSHGDASESQELTTLIDLAERTSAECPGELWILAEALAPIARCVEGDFDPCAVAPAAIIWAFHRSLADSGVDIESRITLYALFQRLSSAALARVFRAMVGLLEADGVVTPRPVINAKQVTDAAPGGKEAILPAPASLAAAFIEHLWGTRAVPGPDELKTDTPTTDVGSWPERRSVQRGSGATRPTAAPRFDDARFAAYLVGLVRDKSEVSPGKDVVPSQALLGLLEGLDRYLLDERLAPTLREPFAHLLLPYIKSALVNPDLLCAPGEHSLTKAVVHCFRLLLVASRGRAIARQEAITLIAEVSASIEISASDAVRNRAHAASNGARQALAAELNHLRENVEQPESPTHRIWQYVWYEIQRRLYSSGASTDAASEVEACFAPMLAYDFNNCGEDGGVWQATSILMDRVILALTSGTLNASEREIENLRLLNEVERRLASRGLTPSRRVELTTGLARALNHESGSAPSPAPETTSSSRAERLREFHEEMGATQWCRFPKPSSTIEGFGELHQTAAGYELHEHSSGLYYRLTAAYVGQAVCLGRFVIVEPSEALVAATKALIQDFLGHEVREGPI